MTQSTVQIQLDVTVELPYDPFRGKTVEQLAKTIEADLHDVVQELRPDLTFSYTGVREVAEFDD